MAEETKKIPDFYANRALPHFEKYFKNEKFFKDGAVDLEALKEKEGLNDAQIAELTEIFAEPVAEAEAPVETPKKKKKAE